MMQKMLTSGMSAARCVVGSYSSGYCPGISPGSLLIPRHDWPGNLNTFNLLPQRYDFFPNATRKTQDFLIAVMAHDKLGELTEGMDKTGMVND